MNPPSIQRHLLLILLTTMTAALSPRVRALTITSGPSLTPAFAAPLSCLLQISTDVPSRVSVSMSDGTNSWQRNFYDYSTAHSIPLLGFKPARTNNISVTVLDNQRNSVAAPQALLFVTGSLPGDFPAITLITNQPALMEPGYTLLRIQNIGDGAGFLTVVDNAGEVVWYSTAASVLDVRQLPNGHLFMPLLTNFVEIDMLGQTVQSWEAPGGLQINYHDGLPTERDSILYIKDAYANVTNFPSSLSDPNAPPTTVNALYNNIIEFSKTNGAILNQWSLLDMLQPDRISYLTYSVGYADLQHANAVIEDPSDDSIIVSLRHQNAVIKFSRETGRLKWILGPPDNWDAEFQPYLLTPVGTPFEWNYGQHGPMLTPQGTLLLYDDGNYRACPYGPALPDFENYSRSVEYSINEETMEVSQVWQFTGTNSVSSDGLYTGLMGNTDWLPQTGNVLIDYPWVSYENGLPPSLPAPQAAMVRIKEVTHDQDPKVVFDLAFFDYNNTSSSYAGYYAYRCHRIPDLYPTAPAPIQDLAVQVQDGFANLQFSGSEANSYTIQGSNDLMNWTALGTPTDTGGGNFVFTDLESVSQPLQYYRVLSQ